MKGDKIAKIIEEMIDVKIRHHVRDTTTPQNPETGKIWIQQSVVDHNHLSSLRSQLAQALEAK